MFPPTEACTRHITKCILTALINVVPAFWYRCVTYLKCKPGVVNKHIETAMLYLQVLSKATTAFLFSDVKLMEANFCDLLVAQFFGQVVQSIMAK